MVAELGGKDVGKQAWAGQTIGDRPTRRGGLYDGVAAGASELRADVANDLEVLGNVLQRFRNILAEFLQRAAAVRTAAIGRGVLDRLASQVIGKRFADRALDRFLCIRRRLDGREFGAFGTHGFEFFEREFELANHLVELFRAAAELHAAQLGENQIEALDFGVALRELRLLRNHQCLE